MLKKIFSVLAFFIAVFATKGSVRDWNVSVPAEHPRVYVRSSDIPSLKAKRNLDDFKFSWSKITGSKNPAAIAFVYLLTKDEDKGFEAVEKALYDLKSLEGKLVAKRWYTPVHIGACVYDWCYDLLTENQKQEFILEFEKFAANSGVGYPASRISVGSGSNEGCLLSGQLPVGLAIYDEQPKMFDAAVDLFFSSFKPVRDYYYRGHSHHQGSDYINRLMYDMFASWLFRGIDAGNVLSTQQQFVPYAIIYNRRPDWRQNRRGDVWDLTGHAGSKRFLAMLVGTYYDDPYLMYYVDEPIWEYSTISNELAEQEKGKWTWGWGTDFAELFHFIFRKPNTKKTEISRLPQTKYFAEPIGEMIMRTGWNMWEQDKASSDALFFMRIGGTFFHGHQHRDMGTFQIFYKGPLASVSGVYQGPDSHTEEKQWSLRSLEHRKNYYNQTLAHNGLLVFDPDEPLDSPLYRSMNDGGQKMPNKGIYPNHNNLQTRYKLASVISHSFGDDKIVPDYSYISGDITGSYSDKVGLVTRSMVALNLKDEKYPAALIAFDRIESKKPTFKKTWLLHSHQEPLVSDNMITIVNNQEFNMYDGKWFMQKWSGKLVASSLLPRDAEITVVGGEGKEFWVNATEKNMPIMWYEDDEPCAWRVEVSPKKQQIRDVFLNVMVVMNESEQKSPEIKLIENDHMVGSIILNRAVLFGKTGKMLDNVEFELTSIGSLRILVCDLTQGNWEISANGKILCEYDVKADENVLYFTSEFYPNQVLTKYKLRMKQ